MDDLIIVAVKDRGTFYGKYWRDMDDYERRESAYEPSWFEDEDVFIWDDGESVCMEFLTPDEIIIIQGIDDLPYM